MIVLGIESTCDETAASIVKDGKEILSNVICSQIDVHKKYGGVFPELASREHVKNIIYAIEQAIVDAKISIKDIELIAVAKGPGLLGSLLIGTNVAKMLSILWEKPLIGVNHVEAHLYAAMMADKNELIFPSLGVVLSGGHTQILIINNIGNYRILGQTVDDAIGESFDKVANMLGFEYPGGPIIEELAKLGNANKYKFSYAKVKKNVYGLSFSGLKTQVLYKIKGQKANKNSPLLIKEEEKKHIAASFQTHAFNMIINKIILAIENHKLYKIYLGGGVSINERLRNMIKDSSINIPVTYPINTLCLDNAAMIATAASYGGKKAKNILLLKPRSNWRLVK